MNTTWLKGIDNNSYHILWGANGFSNYFSFGITANGLYRYSTIDNGNYKDIIPLTASEYINRNGSNSIGVRRNGTIIEFYINYFKVNEFEFSEFYGEFDIFIKSFVAYICNWKCFNRFLYIYMVGSRYYYSTVFIYKLHNF